MIEHAMWLVTILSIIGTVLNIKHKRSCFAYWMVTNATWTVYDIYKDALPQAALMAVYFALAVWGWFAWKDTHK